MCNFIKNFFDLLLHGGEAYHRMKNHPKVIADDFGITLSFSKEGGDKEIAWADLKYVGILTNSAGPFMEDLFFILQTDETQVCIPNETATEIKLMSHFEKLPGFQWEQALQAMTSTSDAVFECWNRSWSTPASNH